MKKTYIIVESPGKVESIQKYLGEKYVVCASYGQIVELAKGGRYGIGVNPLDEFKAVYHLMPDKMKFLDQIIEDAVNIEEIVICTDPDTEGHGIAWHIAHYLRHLGKPIMRAEFQEITKDGILDGLKNITELDYNKYQAQETRRLLDRIVGFMVSPFLINLYKSNLSAGRVQSVATKMVIEREKEIGSFEPKEYWNVHVDLIKGGQECTAKFAGKIKTQEHAEKIKQEVESPSIKESAFEVISAVQKIKREMPPPPLTTARMQQLMASKHGIDGEETMAAAQTLYELGLCTYMRTDSVRISDTALDNTRSWLTNNNFEIPKSPNVFKNKIASQDAHECIRPTDVNKHPDEIKLNKEITLLYRLIWECFVSSQMMPAVYNTLDAKIIHQSSKHSFKMTGKVLQSPGYLALLEKEAASGEKLFILKEGDIFNLKDDKSVRLEQKFTQPPARYTYASLIKELESNGVGRPSTYVQIIGKITHRNYVEKKGNTYYGTDLGIKITDLLSNYFGFMEYDYTASLEKQMDEIAAGDSDKTKTLTDFYKIFSAQLSKIHVDNGGLVCKKCSAPMYVKNSKVGDKFYGCSLYPFCNSIVPVEKELPQQKISA